MADFSSRTERRWLHLMQAGQNAYHSGQLGAAESAFREATCIASEKMAGWLNLGATLAALGEHGPAIAALERAKCISPRFESVYLMLANTYADSGRPEKAVASCREGLSQCASANLWNRLGTLQRTQRLFDEASLSFRNALQCDCEHEYARVNLATLKVLQGRYEEALHALSNILESNVGADTRAEAQRSYQLLINFQRIDKPLMDAFTAGRFDDAITLLDAPSFPPLQEDGVMIEFLQDLCTIRSFHHQNAFEPYSLRDEWPFIESHFSLHKGDGIEAYLSGEASRLSNAETLQAGDVQQYAQAVVARRDGTLKVLFERHPELAFRYAHWLILNGVDDPMYHPGHFKLLANIVAANPRVSRTPPECVAATIRHFYQRTLTRLEDAEVRAAVVYVMVVRTHSFIDGNGRVARYLLNYELEQGGHAPILLLESLKSEWVSALRSTYRLRDPRPLIDAIRQARDFTSVFLRQLEDSRREHHSRHHSRVAP